MNISDMISRFMTSKKAAGVSKATIAWYYWQLKAFTEWLPSQPDQTLNSDLIELYIVSLRDRGLAPGSIRNHFTALRSFFAWCKAKRYIKQMPTDGIHIAKPKGQEIKRATMAEVMRLLDTMPVAGWLGLRDYLAVHLMFYAGLRVGEVVKLAPHHFDLDSGLLHIPGGKSGAGQVPLLRDVVEAYLAYMTHRPTGYTELLLIPADGGGGPKKGNFGEDGVRQMLERRCKQAGIRRLTPHDLRRGLGMHLLNQARADVSLVQRILRHSDVKVTTQAYARWMESDLADEFRSRMESSR